MTFKAFKSSGFDLEKTHLKELKRIQNLILVIMIAFAWCYNVGNYIHQKIEPIKTKKNGIKKISIFKYGLNTIAQNLNNTNQNTDIHIFDFLSCT